MIVPLEDYVRFLEKFATGVCLKYPSVQVVCKTDTGEFVMPANAVLAVIREQERERIRAEAIVQPNAPSVLTPVPGSLPEGAYDELPAEMRQAMQSGEVEITGPIEP